MFVGNNLLGQMVSFGICWGLVFLPSKNLLCCFHNISSIMVHILIGKCCKTIKKRKHNVMDFVMDLVFKSLDLKKRMVFSLNYTANYYWQTKVYVCNLLDFCSNHRQILAKTTAPQTIDCRYNSWLYLDFERRQTSVYSTVKTFAV